VHNLSLMACHNAILGLHCNSVRTHAQKQGNAGMQDSSSTKWTLSFEMFSSHNMVKQAGGSPSKGPRSGVDGPHDSADSSTGLFRSRSLLPAPSAEQPRQLGFSEAWRMVR